MSSAQTARYEDLPRSYHIFKWRILLAFAGFYLFAYPAMVLRDLYKLPRSQDVAATVSDVCYMELVAFHHSRRASSSHSLVFRISTSEADLTIYLAEYLAKEVRIVSIGIRGFR